jgi:energy-coupling factor transport system permease protein
MITLLYIIALFMVRNMAGYIPTILFTLGVILTAKISLKMVLKGIKPILFIIVFTAVLNVFYTQGRVVWEFWIFKVTYEGILLATFMALRLVFLVVGTSLLTYTTSPIMLTDAIENLLGPLKKYRVPVHEMSMMMTIALRFIPTLIEETDKIMSAQKARGADFETGGIIQRSKALIPVLVPLFISAFRRAEELATAMECRCYQGGEGRTRLKQLKYQKIDGLAFFVTLCAMALMLYPNFIGVGFMI